MSTQTAHPVEVLRVTDVCKRLGISRRTLDRWRRSGDFPEPVRLAGQTIVWRVETFDAWLDSRPDGMSTGEAVARTPADHRSRQRRRPARHLDPPRRPWLAAVR